MIASAPQHRWVRYRHLWTTCAVVLAHIALLWAVWNLGPSSRAKPVDEVILASVVLESATHAATSAPSPAPSTQRPPQTQIRAMANPVPSAQPATPAALSAPNAPVASAASTTSPQAHASMQDALPAPPGNSANASAGIAPVIAAAAVVQPSADAGYLNNPAPPYPRQSRRMGEEGTVIVRVLIGVQGSAEKAELRASSGYQRLDDAALETVQRWRYVPGTRNGVAAAMWFNLPVRFVLE